MKIVTFRQLRHRWGLYLLILPALAMVLTFSYFPAASAVSYSFFRWDGDARAEYIGLENFTKAFGDEALGAAFLVVLILIFANLFKMIPSIAAAVVVHRITSERARYLYRVFFVIPMIIPSMVWLLLWKFFYDPNFGPLNRLLNATGLMHVLKWLNSADHGLPALATLAKPWREGSVDLVFGNVPAMMAVGAGILILRVGEVRRWGGVLWLAVRVAGFLAAGLALMGVWPGLTAAVRSGLAAPDVQKGVQIAAAGMWGALAARPQSAALLVTAVLTLALRWFRWPDAALKGVGVGLLVIGAVLYVTTLWWTTPTDAFLTDVPAWLGHQDLILFAFIFWGFPWVGVVSVLLYLSGLDNIDQSIYDAAEIDGCGWFRKFWNIELPLIMTQVRLNLILMCIGTLQAWGLVFILFGDSGGPAGKLMVPGLYMFRKAFVEENQAGYACAVGLLLFFVILTLTLINNRYVRVSK